MKKSSREQKLATLLELSTDIDCQKKLSRVLASKHLEHDSRKLTPTCTFVALVGQHFDGHDFIKEVIDKVQCVIAHKKYQKKIQKESFFLKNQTKIIFVKDTQQILPALANIFYDNPSAKLQIIGITGTNGKTSVSLILEKLYHCLNKACGVIGTIDIHYDKLVPKNKKVSASPLFKTVTLPTANTTPIALDLQRNLAEMAENKVEVVLIEVSSHALALKRVAGIEFDSVIFTNLSPEHLDFHRNMKNYFLAKLRLYSLLVQSPKKNKVAVTCLDSLLSQKSLFSHHENKINKILKKDKAITKIYYHYRGSAKQYQSRLLKLAKSTGEFYSYDLLDFNYSSQSILQQYQLNYTPFSVLSWVRQTTKKKIFATKTNLLGLHNAQNITAALLELLTRQKLTVDLKKRLTEIFPKITIAGRLELISIRRGRIIIDYAHSPDALKYVLQTLSKLKAGKKGKLICLFGCGGNRDQSKRASMGRISYQYADFSIVTTDNPRDESPENIIADILVGLKAAAQSTSISPTNQKYCVVVDRKAAIEKAIELLQKEDILLIAGKGHEQQQIIGGKRIPFVEKKIVLECLQKY